VGDCFTTLQLEGDVSISHLRSLGSNSAHLQSQVLDPADELKSQVLGSVDASSKSLLGSTDKRSLLGSTDNKDGCQHSFDIF
ncbi:hypothetical protein HAX54_018027, partial [Datura stramonium]|nr:hypothetical protein [Datura stramonium]